MVKVKHYIFVLFCCLLSSLSSARAASEAQSQKAPVRVAVASNFKLVLAQLAAEFKRQEPSIRIQVSSASSGVLYAQILRGAPFDLFLSADKLRPTLLEEQGNGLVNSRITYAWGKLVIWSTDKVVQSVNDLHNYTGKIAIANPELAPFGRASQQVLSALASWPDKKNNVIMANNVLQVANMLHSGAVNLGLVSASQVKNVPNHQMWLVPEDLFKPIEQQMVIINQPKSEGSHEHDVESFYRYILSSKGQQIIVNNGYALTIQSSASSELKSD